MREEDAKHHASCRGTTSPRSNREPQQTTLSSKTQWRAIEERDVPRGDCVSNGDALEPFVAFVDNINQSKTAID